MRQKGQQGSTSERRRSFPLWTRRRGAGASHKEGIPYEIVPGVTSPISVPAYNGIPVTHQDFCSSVHVITGHKRKGIEYDIDFGALVHTKGTLVFLMGITAMEDICNGLMKAGMEPDMPAAVLSKGTTAGQKRVVATVGTLKAAADQAKIQTPAIVVGKVCTLADDFAWYEITSGRLEKSLSPGQGEYFQNCGPSSGERCRSTGTSIHQYSPSGGSEQTVPGLFSYQQL